ncbi:hypothetical protein [Mucilaginibacter glaciei]|uniref:Uncharacterized protein n=1 Tax=Mucilaginibacter glaciei TaxID=2772109 RepID=A0A926S0Y4_9SPHI|nr:hypothetical protein [Mucilaginibacter glaciei]MBD1392202.1 hypothetical protein [Mucilaginibacter glaciei]
MEHNYLEDKKVKKKSALKVVYLLVFFGIAFAVLLGKFALSGSLNVFNGLPDSDQAYTIAKGFISPTVLSSPTYSDSEYKFAKKSDSVYVIKSFYTAKDNGDEPTKTNFTITLKYNGGHAESAQNWTMLNLDKE